MMLDDDDDDDDDDDSGGDDDNDDYFKGVAGLATTATTLIPSPMYLSCNRRERR